MMKIRLNSRIQSLILIGSVLTLSACASTKTGGTISGKTDQPSRAVIEKGKFETPSEIKSPKTAETVKTVTEAAPVVSQPPNPNLTKVNSRAPRVNARTAPTTRSRVVEVLKQGQEVEVLESKHGWVKIKWQEGDTAKHGWMNKAYVEGFEK